MLPEVGMPLLVAVEIARVVGMQLVLDVLVARSVHAPLRVLPGIRADEARIGDALQILPPGIR